MLDALICNEAVRDHNRLTGNLGDVPCRLERGMRQVDNHAQSIHFSDRFTTEDREAAMFRRLSLDVAKLIHVVVHQLDRTNSRIPGFRHALTFFLEKFSALTGKYGADLAGLPGRAEVRNRTDRRHEASVHEVL